MSHVEKDKGGACRIRRKGIEVYRGAADASGTNQVKENEREDEEEDMQKEKNVQKE